MTSQQAAAMLHAAGVTGEFQQIHFCGIADDGDEGYTAAIALLEAAGLVGTHDTARVGEPEEYDVMRFDTENGSIVVSAPNGSVERFQRRAVMTPAENLGATVTTIVDGDLVSLTPQGYATLAGLKARVLDLHDPAQRAEFVSNLEARAWRDGDPHDEAAS